MNFLSVLARLNELNADYVVVGGFAAVLHRAQQVTQDVDICVRLGPKNMGRVFDAIEGMNPRARMGGEIRSLSREIFTAATIRNLYVGTDAGRVDILGEIKGLGDFEALVPYISHVKTSIGEIPVLSLDGLILAKEAMGRPRDLETVRLLRALKEEIGEGSMPPGDQ